MKIIFFANTDWYLYNFRLPIAKRLKDDGHEVVMLSPHGEFGERFKRYGLRWVTLPMNRKGLNPVREALTVHALVKIFRKERPDLLHNFTVKSSIYGALAAKFARVPAVINAVAGMGYVFTSEDIRARMLRPLVKALMRWTFESRNSLVILQNPDDVSAFVLSGIVSDHHVRLIRSSGVDVVRFHPTLRRNDGCLRVLLAARLLWAKGIQEYVDAASILRKQGRKIEFLLAGTPDPGNPHSTTEYDVRRWVDAGVVSWLGHVDDMPTLHASVDVMVLPSYYREGVPRCLIEGAASGLALITTGRPGCREVVKEHGVDGLRVEPRDAVGLAKLIAQLDDDRSFLKRLGDRARCTAVNEFDEQLVIQDTLDVYSELLDSSLSSFNHGAKVKR